MHVHVGPGYVDVAAKQKLPAGRMGMFRVFFHDLQKSAFRGKVLPVSGT
jgi:hypothetical protein